jgi:LysM repeat protein
MRLLHYFLVILLVASFYGEGAAQQLKENEIVVIQGQKFVLHQVRTGETIFSISQRFGIDGHTLVEHNPEISEGLKIGDVLKIPYRENMEWQELPVSQKGDPAYFEYHTITSRTETPYFIAREYDITVEEIYAYNPEVTRFRKGTRLRIPRWEQPELMPGIEESERIMVEEETERELIMHEVKPGETLYSLARRYNISESEILFFNPGARELKAGSVIYLPRPETETHREAIADEVDRPGETFADRDETMFGNYFEHTIVSGETLWSVTRRYSVSADELRQLNPILETGFPAGVSIKVPIREEDIASAEPVNEDAFLRHEVQPGETLFGLASTYDITIPEIRKFNPQLDNRNLVRGETLLIPRKLSVDLVEIEIPEPDDSLEIQGTEFDNEFYRIELPEIIPKSCRPTDVRFQTAETYEIALFLPLFVDANEALNKRAKPSPVQSDSLINFENYLKGDTLIEVDEPEDMFHGFYRESENFLQFYEGVLLAVDSLRKTGMSIKLNVFDTQQNADSIRKFIYREEFLETDLIIGPVFPQVQDEVAEIAAKNRIPMVSPLSAQSRELTSNPSFFQVNPTRDFLAVKTAELITEEYFNSNFVVVKTSNSGGLSEEKVVEVVRERMVNSGFWGHPEGMQFQEYDFDREGPFGFRRILSPHKENVIFVASMNEGDLSVILSNINNLTDDFSITLVGFNRYEQFHSISNEFFHNLNLHYLAPYWVDYEDPATIRFLEKFKKHFHTEPNNFGLQGYDVAFYFLNALKYYGRDFPECLPYQRVHLAQGSYRFEKVSQFGGYMNQGVSVISYQRNFDVVRKRVIGPYRFAQR